MNIRKSLITGIILLVLFLITTILVLRVNVLPIGPNESKIGLAFINQFVFNLLGVNILWYHITDWLGFVAIFIALGFAILGLVQLIQRKNLFKVDLDIVILGILYLLVISIYILFELAIVNYRPIIIYNYLEASYPSSHTFIVLTIMLTAIIQFKNRIANKKVKSIMVILSWLVIFITVFGRLVSGVHWVTDIIAGVLLACSLRYLYNSCVIKFK